MSTIIGQHLFCLLSVKILYFELFRNHAFYACCAAPAVAPCGLRRSMNENGIFSFVE